MSEGNRGTGTAPSAVADATRLLQSGDAAAAYAVLGPHLQEQPEDHEALYLCAVCQRYLQQYDAALATLTQLLALRPRYGRAHQEAGHLHLARHDPSAATAAFRQAVTLNDSLIGSWLALAKLLESSGASADAAVARERHGRLAALPPPLLGVRNFMAEGRLRRAETLCREFLKSQPRNVEGMRLLADLGVKTGVLDDAEVLLKAATELEPENSFARFDYMNVLYRRQKYAQSLAEAERLRAQQPDNLDYEIGYANQCVAVGDYAKALPIYERAIALQPRNAELHLVHGHALKTVGETPLAESAYRRAYQARGEFGDAFWSLANLKLYRFTDQEVQRMTLAESGIDTPEPDRVHLRFALGKHYEDMQDYATAFDYYERGNDLQHSLLRYDADDMSARMAAQKEIGTAELLQATDKAGNPAADPIFIVGLPRSGSTLVEQILASHSMVDGTLELPNVPALAYTLSGRRRVGDTSLYPDVLRTLTPEQFREFGATYISDTAIHRQGAPRFIDKMPNNFRHIALIHRMLPNATIIDVRREPMACCFAGYKQLFASGQEFSYNLRDIGRYYRDYVDLMAHWDEVLPGRILRVRYEDVVADLEQQVRRMLTHCGLPFEAQCLEFHGTQRSVRTPSSEQVRQPIYTSALDQWRNFEPWLAPLRDALENTA